MHVEFDLTQAYDSALGMWYASSYIAGCILLPKVWSRVAGPTSAGALDLETETSAVSGVWMAASSRNASN